jgi:hypothetical protein
MADSTQEQNEELTRAGLTPPTTSGASAGGAAAEGAIAALLHGNKEREIQVQDTFKQQVAHQATAQKFEPRSQMNKDPVREGGPGLSHVPASRHAQRGSHGLSGQGPK